jgi:hypothetical protein
MRVVLKVPSTKATIGVSHVSSKKSLVILCKAATDALSSERACCNFL